LFYTAEKEKGQQVPLSFNVSCETLSAL